MKAVVVSGDPLPGTRSLAIAKRYQAALLQYPTVQQSLFDLSIWGGLLGSATTLQQLPDHALDACQQLLDADLMIIICPIFHQGLPGLFKHIFDLLDPTALRNKIALLCTTGNSLYSNVSEQQLRPLLEYFGLFVLPIDSYIPYSELDSAPLPYCFSLNNAQQLQRIYFSVNQAVSLAKGQQRSIVA